MYLQPDAIVISRHNAFYRYLIKQNVLLHYNNVEFYYSPIEFGNLDISTTIISDRMYMDRIGQPQLDHVYCRLSIPKTKLRATLTVDDVHKYIEAPVVYYTVPCDYVSEETINPRATSRDIATLRKVIEHVAFGTLDRLNTVHPPKKHANIESPTRFIRHGEHSRLSTKFVVGNELNSLVCSRLIDDKIVRSPDAYTKVDMGVLIHIQKIVAEILLEEVQFCKEIYSTFFIKWFRAPKTCYSLLR